MENNLYHGDCLDVLKTLDDNSIDTIICDPPYALTSKEYNENHKGGFMNKPWDSKLPSVDIWKECLRVLKHGAFAAVMSSPRQDVLARMIVNLQDAGFNTNFSSIIWTYGTGFPKAANITKLLEKRGIKKPDLEGSFAGCQLKPAYENIIIVEKPLSEKSYTDQALFNGKGITWLDDCRIPFQNDNDIKKTSERPITQNMYPMSWNEELTQNYWYGNNQGRFPANLLVCDDVLNDGKVRKSGKFENHHVIDTPTTQGIYGEYNRKSIENQISYGDVGSYSRFFDLDKWFDTTFPFLIVPKASTSERNKGLDKWISKVNDGRQTPIDNPFQRGETVRKNIHPTTKPLKLMSWLVTLLSRPQDTVLDPFMGSGTTCIAAKLLKRKWIGIEKELEYLEIARQRINAY